MKYFFLNFRKNYEDVTVVVQGAFSQETISCVKSIKKYLPGSKIIISTWEGTELEAVEKLNVDLVIYNKDPGFTFYQNKDAYPDAKINNVNRQIVSTASGLMRCTTTYALKMRSDFILKGNGFVETKNKFPKRSQRYQVFGERITVLSILDSNGVLFSPCDWAFFGRTADLTELFNIPLMPPDEAEYIPRNMSFLLSHGYLNLEIYEACKYSVRYLPENYIFYSSLKNKYHDLDYDNYTDCRISSRLVSEEALANNFVVYDMEIAPLRERLKSPLAGLKRGGGANRGGWINKKEWEKLYEKYTR